ncbi:MAG: sugar phosphate isomerase/epimerase [Candidatus Omnitrophica bacterium]|nr:sugar phosphate isomerase/epimerase [Candidatus Omnitrophota bacterium]
MKIAIQLYTIREFNSGVGDFSKAIKKLSDIGYRYVETAGLANLSPEQFKKIMDDNGLKVCSSHTGLDRILKEPEAIASEQTKLNAFCCNISWPGSQSHDMAAIKKIAEKIEEAARTLKTHGITLGYHNHGIEFAKCNGKTWLEIIMESASKEILTAQIDTYWVQYGGGDPALWITKYANRLNSIHFKDMGMTTDNKQAMVPVGTGNLNWQKILTAAKRSTAKYAIAEMDFCPLHPLWDAIKISFENMKNWALEPE